MREYIEVSVDLILPPEKEMRLVASREGLEELANDIRDRGILQPLLVRREKDRFRLVAGWRRLEAAKICRLPVVPVCVVTGSDFEAEIMKVQENIMREDVNPIDEAKFYHSLVATYGLTVHDLCDVVHKSRQYVETRFDLMALDKSFQEAIEGDRISISVARELGRIDDYNERQRTLTAACENGITLRVARMWVADYERQKLLNSPSDVPDGYVPHATVNVEIREHCQLCSELMEGVRRRILVVCSKCYHALMVAKENIGEAKKEELVNPVSSPKSEDQTEKPLPPT